MSLHQHLPALAVLLALTFAPAALTHAATPAPARTPAQHGAILSGTVSNTATGNLLEGAKVELPQLQLSALADNTGRYLLTGVPAGTHTIVVSYIGLDSVRREVTVVAGQRVAQDFDLTTAI
jgi:hypothetical protein